MLAMKILSDYISRRVEHLGGSRSAPDGSKKMNNIMTIRGIGGAALGCLVAVATAAPAQAFSPEDYLASIGLIGSAYCPRGTVEAAGQLLPINQNQALFALLGTTYGGNGQVNFALPDLRGKEPVPGTRYCVLLQGIFPSRD